MVKLIPKMTLGHLLKKAREAQDCTTTFIALRVDIKPSTLILVEKGEKYPTPDYFVDLCKLLEIDYEKAWKLLREEKMKLYEQRLMREYQYIDPTRDRK